MQMLLTALPKPEILIVGAGIIGLTLALELDARGAQVTVLERDTALSHASTAAAGMLAAKDPHNPPELAPLSQFSIQLYPAFIHSIEKLSHMVIPWQTTVAVQYLPDGSKVRLDEHSIDPRQLAPALLAAVRASNVDLRENIGELELADTPDAIYVRDIDGNEYTAPNLVHTNGAWFKGQRVIAPRKGQMLRVHLPQPLNEVHRSEHVYIVPRTAGPQAGTALIGATVEDAGFDTTTHPADLARLRTMAAELVPGFADEPSAPRVEAWAGLRPVTADGLPLLGVLPFSPREFIANGHFRNGILLAPATAHVMADLIEGKQPTISLAAFAPERFVTV